MYYIIKNETTAKAWNCAAGWVDESVATRYTEADYRKEKHRPLPLGGEWKKII